MTNVKSVPNDTILKDGETQKEFIVDESSGSELDASESRWGWVVVFASFMVHVLADGVTYSFGVLTTEFISDFDASRESVGWLASILVGMTLSAGPLASILSNKFGFQSVTMVGALIAAIGFCAPFFYPAFWFLFLSTSVMSGIGFGLAYLPSIVTVSIYFEEKRAFVTGLAVCGSGIGTFVFSPLIEFLIETYGWRGSMLIIGALILNCMACGAVYRPLRNQDSQSNYLSISSSQKSIMNEKSMIKSMLSDMSDHVHSAKHLNRDFTSAANVNDNLGKNKKCRYICSAPDIQGMIAATNLSPKKNVLKVSYPHILISSQMSLQMDRQKSSHYCNSKSQEEFSSPLKGSQLTMGSDEIKNCLQETFNFDLLKNPIFILFAMSNFFTSIGFNAPFLYAKDRALIMGIENNHASFLISSIGIGNTFGRVIFGYLSTKKFVNRLQLYNFSLVASGLVIMLSSLATTYGWMIGYTMSFGVLTGTYVTLTSIVLVDLLGIELLNASFGMTMIAQGAAVFIGPPLAGWIFDLTKSFDWSFWVCGAFLSLSGAMLYLIYCFKDFRTMQNSEKYSDP